MKAMKKNRLLCVVLVICLTVSMLAGCSKRPEGFLDGKWSYIYDTKTIALKISTNGKAVFDGIKYDCEYDEDYIYLKSKEGTQTLRYKKNGEDGIFIYKVTTYRYESDEPHNGLAGCWVSVDNERVAYEFTEDGYFREDFYIPGFYTVNEDEGTIFCVYNDHYEDTTVYYTLDGDTLVIEYPWPMVKKAD